MKILQLTTRLRVGGIATYIEVLSTQLKKRGHDVFVAAQPAGAQFLLERSHVPFTPMELETKFEWHPKLLFAARRLEKFIRQEKIELVHAHTRVTQVLASGVCKRLNIPMVSTCHGFYKPRWGRRLFPAWGERVIAISPEVGQYLIDVFGVSHEKVSIVPNAVDVEQLKASLAKHNRRKLRNEWGLHDRDFVLCTVARLEQVKGQEYLIDAVAQLKDSIPHLKLLLVGSGGDEFRLRNLVREKSIAERVIFAGTVFDVTKALCASDVFVLPQTWEEGFGLSVAEAMIAGLPVVASGTGAIAKIIRNEETGLLIRPGNVDDLISAIKKLATDPRRRDKISHAGQVYARESFSADRFVSDIEKVYSDVAAQFRSVTGRKVIASPDGAKQSQAGSKIASASLGTTLRNDKPGTVLFGILGLFWKGWMAFARALGYVQTRIILFLLYFFIIGPLAIMSHLFGANMLEERGDFINSFWHIKSPPLDETKEGLARQF